VHSESLVHQHGTPATLQTPPGEVTLSHVPAAHDHELGADVASAQSAESYAPAVVAPLHVPVHWLFALEHAPLGQSESATHRHAVCPLLHTGAGDSAVVHE
jgi:hypothetical protein